MRNSRLLAICAVVLPLLVFLAIYIPAVGHGFIKDDAVWILQSRAHSLAALAHLFHSDNGFYRPVVSLSFALNEWLSGTNAKAYGLTNVLLAALCFVSIIALARALGFSRGAAVLAGLVWLLNPNAIPGSMTWISGRTYFLLTLSATACATAFVRGRVVTAILLLIVALFTKEEAVLLAPILLAWVWLLPRTAAGEPRPVRADVWVVASVAALGLYWWARSATHAMTPQNAPSYYRLGLDTALANAPYYADWTLTFAVALTIFGLGRLGVTRPMFDSRLRALLLCSAVWIACGLALTVAVPSRSVLYAVFPSVGASLACGAILERAWTASSSSRQNSALIIALLLIVAFTPFYVIRARRNVRIADLSAQIMRDLPAATQGLSDGSLVVLADDRSDPHVNLEAAFGGLLSDAFRLASGRQLRFQIEPSATPAQRCDGCQELHLSLDHGRLVK